MVAVVATNEGPDAPSCYVTARWRLEGATLPPLWRSVAMGDLVRRALMARAATLLGEDRVPAVLSGHGLAPGDDHLAILPEDADGDGFVDHLVAHLPVQFDNRVLRALTTLTRIWDGAAGEWLVVENWVVGPGEPLGTLVQTARRWLSATPFVNPLHTERRGRPPRPPEAALKALARRQGLPPIIDAVAVARVTIAGAHLRPVDFEWLRPRSPTPLPPDKEGSFWRLTFAEPITGPVALGYNRHYGLGLFRPVVG